MRYFLVLLACAGFACVQPANASETTEQIKRACAIPANMDHPVCVKRAERAAKMRAKREAKAQAELDSILGRDPAAKTTH